MTSSVTSSVTSTIPLSSTAQERSPFVELVDKIGQVWDAVLNCIVDFFRQLYHCVFQSGPETFGEIDLTKLTINTDLSRESLQKVYWGLGKENKWKECIDGEDHQWGREVYDKGLHGGTKEPGYIASMEKACDLSSRFLGTKIDADWFLMLHKHTAGHFKGAANGTLMGQEKVGVFRNTDDNLHCKYRNWKKFTPSGRAELAAYDSQLKRELGSSFGLGDVETVDYSTTRMNYKVMDRAHMRILFNKFMHEYYQEAAKAKTVDEKFTAVARVFQRLEWLHPPRDGATRTDVQLLHRLLTEQGFHPAILKSPHVATSYGLEEWKKALFAGLMEWEKLRKP